MEEITKEITKERLIQLLTCALIRIDDTTESDELYQVLSEDVGLTDNEMLLFDYCDDFVEKKGRL